MKISGEKYRFALLSDGATHKNFRRLGLFERLLSHVNEICLNKNVFFVYGTGNEKSRKAFYKLGFEDFFTTFKATRKMRYNHPLMKVYNLFLNSFGKLALKENYGINEISIREYSEFIGNLNKDNANTFDKSENYLKWRLAETTGKYHVYGTFDENQELQAIVVVKMSKGLLYIVDINYNEDVSYIHKLLKFIRSLAIKNNKITRINCIHNNFKNLNKVFKSNNFQITKNKSSALIFILKSDFEISQYELDNMHYMRIDKNE